MVFFRAAMVSFACVIPETPSISRPVPEYPMYPSSRPTTDDQERRCALVAIAAMLHLTDWLSGTVRIYAESACLNSAWIVNLVTGRSSSTTVAGLQRRHVLEPGRGLELPEEPGVGLEVHGAAFHLELHQPVRRVRRNRATAAAAL